MVCYANYNNQAALLPDQTTRYSATISSADGTRGLLAGLPLAKACSAISGSFASQAAGSMPKPPGVGTSRSRFSAANPSARFSAAAGSASPGAAQPLARAA